MNIHCKQTAEFVKAHGTFSYHWTCKQFISVLVDLLESSPKRKTGL